MILDAEMLKPVMNHPISRTRLAELAQEAEHQLPMLAMMSTLMPKMQGAAQACLDAFAIFTAAESLMKTGIAEFNPPEGPLKPSEDLAGVVKKLLERLDNFQHLELIAARLLELAEMARPVGVDETETLLKTLDDRKIQDNDVSEHGRAVGIFVHGVVCDSQATPDKRLMGAQRILMLAEGTGKLEEIVPLAERYLQGQVG